MQAIDKHLAELRLRPSVRMTRLAPTLWEGLGWEGSVVPADSLADDVGFEGDVLMAKALRWYTTVYGNKTKSSPVYGFAPARLGNTLWRVRAPIVYGQVRLFLDRNLENKGVSFSGTGQEASFNIFCAVDEMTNEFASRLSEVALREQLDFHLLLHQSLQWRESLPRSDLLLSARNDYDSSTADIMASRFAQARWAAQQAIEKTLKALLKIGGSKYPMGGPKGHSLVALGKLLSSHHEVKLSTDLLETASCSARVRYGEESSSEDQALIANHIVLEILRQLSVSAKVQSMLGT